MTWLYDWVADILCFLILMSLLEMLLPSKNYVRYIRFFAGAVLILVTIRPLLGGLGIAGEIDRYFEEFRFQSEVRDIRQDVLGIEEERRQRMLAEGEEAAAAQVAAMAREAGLVPVRAEVELEKDTQQPDFGTVIRVTAAVREKGTGGTQTTEEKTSGQAVAAVPPVKIEVAPVEIGPPAAETETAAGSGGFGTAFRPDAAHSALEELKRKVERFYELEPENVEIQLEGREAALDPYAGGGAYPSDPGVSVREEERNDAE